MIKLIINIARNWKKITYQALGRYCINKVLLYIELKVTKVCYNLSNSEH